MLRPLARALTRVFALLVLASIAHDLTESGCDPLRVPGTTPVTAEAADGAGDPCDDVCVPDCYCCSATLAAGERVRFESPVAVAPLRTAVRSNPSAGVASVPDPVPRASA